MPEKSKKQGLKAIVADDYPLNRKNIADIISAKSPDIEIHEAFSGEELVKKVKKHDYAFIISDNQMGKMSGLEAVEKIRKGGYDKPICLYSADSIEDEAINAGATNFIRKGSYNSDQRLKETIQKYIKKTK